MLAHLLNLLFVASTLAVSTTYNLTTDGTHWLITGVTGPNPSINTAVGDVLIFNVAGLPTTVFAIHHNLSSTSSQDRVPTSPGSITGSGTLTLTINAGYGGLILYYEDESNPTASTGDICISLDHCTMMSSCGGNCTACAAGFSVTVGGTCGMDAAVTCPSPLPSNCATAQCWMTAMGVQVQCSTCVNGFFISNSTCVACNTTCLVGQFISSPCGTFNDRICSPCSPCPSGSVMSSPCSGNGTTDDTTCINSNTSSPTPPTTPPTTPPPTTNGTCSAPPNCKTAECLTATEAQCTECNSKFFVNTNSNSSCTACTSCSPSEYISWPCEGFTDTVCSQCYSEGCSPCQVGYSMDANGLCVAQLCLLYGCGASNIDATCQEDDSSHYICVCPGESNTVVAINGSAFAGCTTDIDNPPAVNDIIAHINGTNLEAFLLNGMSQLLGASLVTTNGNTFTLNITATVPISGLTQNLETELAKFFGGNYNAQDFSISAAKKRASSVSTGQVTVTVQTATTSSPASSVQFTSYTLIGLAAFFLALY